MCVQISPISNPPTSNIEIPVDIVNPNLHQIKDSIRDVFVESLNKSIPDTSQIKLSDESPHKSFLDVSPSNDDDNKSHFISSLSSTDNEYDAEIPPSPSIMRGSTGIYKPNPRYALIVVACNISILKSPQWALKSLE